MPYEVSYGLSTRKRIFIQLLGSTTVLLSTSFLHYIIKIRTFIMLRKPHRMISVVYETKSSFLLTP